MQLQVLENRLQNISTCNQKTLILQVLLSTRLAALSFFKEKLIFTSFLMNKFSSFWTLKLLKFTKQKVSPK